MPEFIGQISPPVAFLLFLLALVGIALAGQALWGTRDPLEERINRMRGVAQGASGGLDSWFRNILKWLKGRIAPIKVLGEKEARKVRSVLVAAGYRSEEALIAFILAKILLALGFAAIAAGFLLIGAGERGALSYIVVLGAALGGNIFADMVVKKMANRRRTQIRNDLPDAIEILMICLRASMTFEAAMQRFILEAREYMLQMAIEMELTLNEMQLLQDRGRALARLAQRVGLPEISSFASTVSQAERFGTSLVESFEVLSDEMRKTRLLKAEEWATRAPVLITIPMVFFLLPIFFIVVLGPALIKIIETLKNVNLDFG